MSAPGDPGQELRERLEWLRLMGVEEIRIGGGRTRGAAASPPASPAVSSPPAERPESQATLFGEAEPPAPTRRRDPDLPDLSAVRAPAAAGPEEGLRAVREDLGDCKRCRLCEGRTHIVFGVGNPRARVMFVGEGPGADEDAKGEPFVGRAGQLLTRIIESMGYTRQEVYIANVVKCRPPENRTPRPDEVAECAPFLFRQIQTIRPRVVVCLGTPAVQTVLRTKATITHLRGEFRDLDGIRIMPTYHPAYLLRNPNAKKDVWEDMKKVMAFLKSDAATGSPPSRA